MKILIFYQYFGTPKGGWSTRFYEFTRRWAAQGHQVTVVTSPYYKSDIKANGFITKTTIEGVNLIIINTPDSNKNGVFKRATNALIFASISIFYALTYPFDIVLSSSGPITIGVPALVAKILRGKKMVFEVRDLWPKGGIDLGKITNPYVIKSALWFEKFCYKNSSLIVACSEGMKDGVQHVFPNSNTIVIPNSSDTELFSNNSKLPDVLEINKTNIPYFVYIGSLGYMDDCSQIIYGIHKAKDLSFKMYVLGDGEEKQKLIDLTSNLGLQEKIEFLGLVPKTEVVNWLSNATASFVTFRDFPVLHTSSPNKMFDSFAAGVPIIQSTKGWIKKLVEDENVGWNVEHNDPRTFAFAIRDALHQVVQTKEKGVNAKRIAETKFSRDILSQFYLNNLTQLLP